MHKGKVKKLIRDRGFGFISDIDGREVFFHRNSLVGIEFETLNEEQEVQFEIENSPKGPRAINISLATA
jgi:CspA family cold shock protein